MKAIGLEEALRLARARWVLGAAAALAMASLMGAYVCTLQAQVRQGEALHAQQRAGSGLVQASAATQRKLSAPSDTRPAPELTVARPERPDRLAMRSRL